MRIESALSYLAVTFSCVASVFAELVPTRVSVKLPVISGKSGGVSA
jgi:hypothetical protein